MRKKGKGKGKGREGKKYLLPAIDTVVVGCPAPVVIRKRCGSFHCSVLQRLIYRGMEGTMPPPLPPPAYMLKYFLNFDYKNNADE